MRGPPRPARWLLRALLPDEIAVALEGDLTEGHARRAAGGGRLGAALWYWGQVLRLPYLRLRRGARRLRRRDRSPSGTGRGGEEMLKTTAGTAVRELRVAARSLARRPMFTGIVIVTLAASLGVATLIFSVLEGVLLRPLPYPEPETLVNVHATSEDWRSSENAMIRQSWDRYGTSLDQLDVLRGSGALAALGASRSAGDVAVVREGGPAEKISMGRVTEGLFDVLAVEPAVGRLPSADELAEGARVVVLAHGLWTERFGADPDVVGRSVALDDEPYTVVGVMPSGFSFPSETVRMWAPLTPTTLEYPGQPVLRAVGRLAPGVEPDEAGRILDGAARRMTETDPEMEGIGIRVVTRLEEEVGNVRPGLLLLTGSVAMVLLLASVNLANLLIARTSRRREELAIRSSLGAGRAALLWALGAEVVVLCVAGAGLGVALAVGALDPFVAALEASVAAFPRAAGIRLNVPVLGTAALAALLTAVAATLPAAMMEMRDDPSSTLRKAGRGGGRRRAGRAQGWLLFAESSLSVVLLAGAALLARSFLTAVTVDPGYQTRGVVYADVDAGAGGYEEPAERDAFFRTLTERLAALPGVESGALASGSPGSGGATLNLLRPADRPEEEASIVPFASVGPGYFETLEMPLLRGRGFEPADTREAPAVTIVSESLARRLRPDGDVIGTHVVYGTGPSETRMEVVGVVGDARLIDVQREAEPRFYPAITQRSAPVGTILLRVAGDPAPVMEAVRSAAAQIDPAVIVEEVGTVEEGIARSLASVRLRTYLIGAMAGLALVLALVGIFGIVAQAVEQQTREIGIRMALGSGAAAEVRRVVVSVVVPVVLGSAVGAVAAFQASGLLEAFVEDRFLQDPLGYAVAPVLMLAAAGLAAWLPARRAAGIHPAEALSPR